MKKIPSGLYIFAVLILGFLLRILLYKNGTFFIDLNSFISWSNTLISEGIANFYKVAWSDYLPGYLYVLWILGKVGNLISHDGLFLYKLPAILSDLATGYLIYLIVGKLKDRKTALIASSFYIFNPAVFFNSTLWGQVDSLTALFYLLSIYLASIFPVGSALALAVGTAIKPQVIIAAPIIIMLFLKNKLSTIKMIGLGLLFLLATTIIFVPFNHLDKSPFFFIYERILMTLNQYPFGSVNAFNLWGLWGFWKSDSIGLVPSKIIGILIFLLISAIAFIRLRKQKGGQYQLAAILAAANFLFFTRMHERHLLFVFAPLAVSASLNPALWVSYLGFSSTYVLNLYYAYEQTIGGISGLFSALTIKALVFSNFIFFVLLFIKEKAQGYFDFAKKKAAFPRVNFNIKTLRIILGIVLIFSVASRVAWLWSPPGDYFDEVYHAFTARTILHNDPKAWEWWNTPPEGYAFEWTHPPLAKLGMVAGMLVFGENSFGWRIPGALLGVGSVLLVYLIARKIFKDELLAIMAAGIFSLDGLTLTTSRIGMNDTYLLFFVLATIYFYLKDKNLLSALALGLAISSKWSAVWVLPILLVSFFVFKKRLKLSYLWFLVIPPLVYLASYIPMFTTGHDLNIFWGMQKQMWWYHTGLKATHPYTSPWWTWPLLARPIYLYTSNEAAGAVSRIYAMGNPLIFWSGLISIFASLVYCIREKNKKLGMVVFSYLVFFVPWAASPRIMFLYHYLPSVAFMSISLAYILRRFPKSIVPVFALGLVLFIYFYPHWAGLQVPLGLDKSYYWFSSWR